MLTKKEIEEIKSNAEDIDFEHPYDALERDNESPMKVTSIQGYDVSLAHSKFRGKTLFDSLLITSNNNTNIDPADAESIAKDVLGNNFQQVRRNVPKIAQYVKVCEPLVKHVRRITNW